MNADSAVALRELKVDGGMTSDNLLMQFVADVLDVPVVRPLVAETVSSAPPTPPDSPPATGPTWRCCAATGTGPRNGCPTWTPPTGRRSTTTGRRPWNGHWGGSSRRNRKPALPDRPAPAPFREGGSGAGRRRAQGRVRQSRAAGPGRLPSRVVKAIPAAYSFTAHWPL